MLYRIRNWWLTGGESEGFLGQFVFIALILLGLLAAFGIGGNLDRGVW